MQNNEELLITKDAHFERIGSSAKTIANQAEFVRTKNCQYTTAMLDGILEQVEIIKYLVENAQKL